MRKRDCIYQPTAEGLRAWRSPESGLPTPYRMLLGIIQRATHCDEVIASMAGHSEKQILDWLDELDTLCFLASFPTVAAQPAWRRAA